MRQFIIPTLAVVMLAGCVTERQTTTTRTATEELLVSSAADRAATALAAALPPQATVYVDTGNLDGDDGKYAIGAIEDQLLRRGCAIVATKADANTVVALRAGALAMNNRDKLVGLPSLTLPIPLTGAVNTPTVAFYEVQTQQGVAQFSATASDVKTGKWIASAGPAFGLSHVTHYTLLLFFSWHRQDIVPKEIATEANKS